MRGVASREAFTEGGATAGLAIVFIERVLGLIGLLVVVALALTIWPLPGVSASAGVGALALFAALSGLGALALAPRVASRFSERSGPLGSLARVAGRIPRPRRAGPYALALGLSVITHALTAASGHVLIAELSPQVEFGHSLSAVSIAAVSAFVPFTHAGLGVRETAFTFLFGKLGVPAEEAVAASLAFLAVQMAVAAIGGLTLFLGSPRATEGPTDRESDHSAEGGI